MVGRDKNTQEPRPMLHRAGAHMGAATSGLASAPDSGQLRARTFRTSSVSRGTISKRSPTIP